MITKKQKQEVIRVCGENYEPEDVPALWRQEALDQERVDQENAIIEEDQEL